MPGECDIITVGQRGKMSGIEDMNNRSFLSLVAAGLMVLCLGCTEGHYRTASGPIDLGNARKSQVMEVAEQVLRRMHFTVEKYDVDKGIIRTKPLSGAQFFEFWRKDNVTLLAAAEANLHSIRRTIEVTVADKAGAIIVDCHAKVTRLSIPEMQITGMSQAARLYTNSDAGLQRLRLNAEQAENMAWIDLGEDAVLQGRILEQIQNRVMRLKGLN